MQVLVDSAPALGRKGGVGRSYADAPEIDGTVRLLPPEKASKTLKVGEFTRARIVATEGHDLVACRCEPELSCDHEHPDRPMNPKTTEPDPPSLPAPDTFDAIAGARCYKASTVSSPTPPRCARAALARTSDGYTYGLHGTPTTFTLEERIATLEGRPACAAGAQRAGGGGLVDLALLSSGDEVLLPDNVYGPSKRTGRHELARLGHHPPPLRPDDAASWPR
jgi:hypothetical protein